MNKISSDTMPVPADPDMMPEYDFTGAVRGKYTGRFTNGYSVRVERADQGVTETRFVRLAPELAAAFPNDEDVLAVLHEWLQQKKTASVL